MTDRIYYYDATRRTFTAHIVAREQHKTDEGVQRPAVCLNRTTFYPTSGGQPHDTGLLADVRVIDVVEDEDGEVWHLLARELPPDLTEVTGQIDWPRRFDHMQQHSGQHLLSAAFEDAGPDILGRSGHTIGFHLGTDTSTIDLDLSDLTWEAAFEIEATVNHWIWQNREIDVSFVPVQDVASLELRKPPAVHITREADELRVISVAGLDASACGGTHVRATGEIGVLKITSLAHYKGGTRVVFLCGGRALKAYQQTLQTLQAAGTLLTVGLEEVPEAITRVQDEARESRRELRRVLNELLTYEADRIWREASRDAGRRVIISYWEGRDFDEVRTLAAQFREQPATVVLLAATEPAEDQHGGVRMICARSDDLPEVDASEILRAALAGIGGRGGGRPTLAQGGASYQPAGVVVSAMEAQRPRMLA